MKKIFWIILFLSLISTNVIASENTNNNEGILILTKDCSEAITLLKKNFPLSEFGSTAKIGTPFSIEEISLSNEFITHNECWGCYFPVLVNGEIVSYINLTVDKGKVFWAAGPMLSNFAHLKLECQFLLSNILAQIF